MGINYRIITRNKPQDTMATFAFYGTVKAEVNVVFAFLIALISELCTVAVTDFLAVLNRQKNFARVCKQGRIVRLYALNTFQTSLSSFALDTEEVGIAKAVKPSQILYNPTKRIGELLAYEKYQKAG